MSRRRFGSRVEGAYVTAIRQDFPNALDPAMYSGSCRSEAIGDGSTHEGRYMCELLIWIRWSGDLGSRASTVNRWSDTRTSTLTVVNFTWPADPGS